MDHFQAVGELGLGSRLRRLSESFMTEVKAVYTAEGCEFEPRWFPLFSLLLQKQEVTVTSAAQELALTHPHVSQLAKELVRARLAVLRANPRDGRSRMLVLTAQGRELGEKVQPIWRAIRAAVKGVLQESEPDWLARMARVEAAMGARPFAWRIQEALRGKAPAGIRLRRYEPELRVHFERLNREWIEKFFCIEPHDLEYFADPEGKIVAPGGDLIFAELDGEVVGTCALVCEDGGFELAKLAVTERAKGRGIGEALVIEIVRLARDKGARSITLTTNASLTAAVRLYEKLGFETTYRGQHPRYQRVDLVMEKSLT